MRWLVDKVKELVSIIGLPSAGMFQEAFEYLKSVLGKGQGGW